MYPLSGKLIDGKASYRWLSESAENTVGLVSICSAFLRSSILEDFSSRFPSNTNVRVVARWQLGDLLAGASDLESYHVCKKMGWSFYICTNFHGKVFVLPPNGILVGSANATGSGLGLLSNSNSEVCTVVEETFENEKLVADIFRSSTLMTDSLFEKLTSIYNESNRSKKESDWPESIYAELNPSNSNDKIFLSECLASNGDEIILQGTQVSIEAKLDASLLALPSGESSHKEIAHKLMNSKIFGILNKLLAERGGEVYFGALTEAIHSSLLEDPAPYRRDVKLLVQNLYSWVAHLEKHLGLVVDRPKHSERIRRL